MQLSKRMLAVANLAGECNCLADIGTDHGYVPIYMIEEDRISHAIACDVNKGPLYRAEKNIAAHGLQNKIETRLSDGLHALKPGDADALVIAGMGGSLTIRILDEGKDVLACVKKMVLQPQSEIHLVRKYLYEHGFYIADEDMVYEDGKYYPMMLAVPGKKDLPEEMEAFFGPVLIKKRHDVLKAFLTKEEQSILKVRASLSLGEGERIESRMKEIDKSLERINRAKERMKGETAGDT